jgi:nicotinate-nucleotide adenylyltransferase
MPAKRRIGVMGGTFDPIHNGHLVAASEVVSALDLDEVLFVPTGKPWQKQEVSPAEHRYLMSVVATASNPQFKVSRVDVDRPGFTYTVDTLNDLREQFPNAELFFISGADAIAQIIAWKDSRPGHKLKLPKAPPGAISELEVPALAISSTDVRQRVADGKPIWYLVPDGVVQYISKHHLYGS